MHPKPRNPPKPLKQKLTPEQILSAHKKAPLDYISPWQAQHQQLYLAQSQSQNSEPKTRTNSEGKQNVVQSFLEKIRKTQNLHRKSRLSRMGRNYSLEDKELGVGGNSLGMARKESGDDKIVRNQSMMNSEAGLGLPDNKQKQSKSNKNIDDVRDVGFGLLQYAKVPSSQLFTSLAQSKAQPQPQPLHTHSQKFPNQPTRTRIFTQQQVQNPQQVVFIRKKKNSKNMTVVNINETAQQFYEEEIRYAQLKMLQKYRKLGRNKNLGAQEMKEWRRRCETQGGSRSKTGSKRNKEEGNSRLDYIANKQYITDRKLQTLINKQEIKKKYCFMDTVKDQTIVDKMRNLIRNHPSLANTILITK